MSTTQGGLIINFVASISRLIRLWQIISRSAKLISRPRANEQVSIHAPRPCHDYYLQFLGMSVGRDESVSGAFLIGRLIRNM